MPKSIKRRRSHRAMSVEEYYMAPAQGGCSYLKTVFPSQSLNQTQSADNYCNLPQLLRKQVKDEALRNISEALNCDLRSCHLQSRITVEDIILPTCIQQLVQCPYDEKEGCVIHKATHKVWSGSYYVTAVTGESNLKQWKICKESDTYYIFGKYDSNGIMEYVTSQGVNETMRFLEADIHPKDLQNYTEEEIQKDPRTFSWRSQGSYGYLVLASQPDSLAVGVDKSKDPDHVIVVRKDESDLWLLDFQDL